MRVIRIGNQIWTAENLNAEKFRNGECIYHAKSKAEWQEAAENKQPAFCYFDNDPSNGAKYGKLYNWYAVSDPRGLAPAGWHIPSDMEWKLLVDFLGGEDIAGTKMKGTSGWEDNGNGTNESGFNGLAGGNRTDDGRFVNIGQLGNWWSSTEFSLSNALNRWMYFDVPIILDSSPKSFGFSVRCIRA